MKRYVGSIYVRANAPENVWESNNITEVVINIPLHGTIDLSFMEDDKYKYVRTLIFSEGKITDLIHVPQNITDS